MAVLRFYAVAAAYGQPPDKLEVVSSGTWLAPTPESAAAGCVSSFYCNGGARLPLLGTQVWEITPEAMRHALQQIEASEKAGSGAIVPFSVVPSDHAAAQRPAPSVDNQNQNTWVARPDEPA